jgi:hypothetical protein
MNVSFAAAAVLAVSLAYQGNPPADSPPAKDSRGIPVASNPAQAPEGANRPTVTEPAPDPQTVFAPRPSAGDYPPCTREVTDGCIQVHEVGRGPR